MWGREGRRRENERILFFVQKRASPSPLSAVGFGLLSLKAWQKYVNEIDLAELQQFSHHIWRECMYLELLSFF
jgi:hypothetical protein